MGRVHRRWWVADNPGDEQNELADVILTNPAQGDLIYHDVLHWQNLAAGTSGYVLTTQGPGANPMWAALPADIDTLATLSDVMLTGAAQGDLLYRNATQWVNLPHGTSGQFLKTQGASANPIWASPPATNINATAFGSEPGSPSTGDLDLYTNAPSIARWNGTSWVRWGKINEWTNTPAAASLTALNVTTASIIDSDGGLWITAPSIGSSHLEGWYKALAAGAYTWIVRLDPLLLSTTFTAAGLFLQDSVSGKIISFEQYVFGGGNMGINVTQWSDANTRFSNAFTTGGICQLFSWFKVTDDGTTNRTYSISHDGQNWIDLLTESRTTYLGVAPNRAGIFACPNGFTVGLNVFSWTGV